MDTAAAAVRPDDPTSPAAADRHGRWGEFRLLCRYYMECVRLEGGKSVELRAEDEGKRWIQLLGAVDWGTLSAGGTTWLRRDEVLDGLIRASKLGRAPRHMLLGAPVARERDRKSRADRLSPVFLQPVQVVAEAEYLRVESTGTVHVNHGWFEHRFRRDRAEGEDFLIRAGLLQPGSEVDILTAPPGVAVDELWRNLAGRLPRDWAESFADLAKPQRMRGKELGLCPTAVLVRPRASGFTQGLLAELREIAVAPDVELDKTALRWLFTTVEHPGSEPASAAEVAEVGDLNENQRDVTAKAQVAPLLVVKGPPGTGKSTVVRHVVINSLLGGRSTLFASRNHRALDAVVPGLNQLVEGSDRALMLRLTPPKGATTAVTLSWMRMITDLLTQPDLARPEEEASAIRRVGQALSARHAAEQEVADRIDLAEELAACESEVLERLRDADWSEKELTQAPPLGDPDQMERLAARLAGSWIERMRCRVAARRALKFTCSRPGLAPSPGWRATSEEWIDALGAWTVRSRAKSALERRQALADRASQTNREQLERRLRQGNAALHAATHSALEAVACSFGARLQPSDVEAFANLRGALHGQGDSVDPRKVGQRLARLIREHFAGLLRAFPAWACSNLSLRSRLPLVAGVFDLTIVDEASQCDIASVIPLLYRSKRAMIVGDPMQLRHMATVGNQTDLRIREPLGLADDARYGRFRYGPNSIYDLAASSARVRSRGAVAELVEHYRCHPAIARYFGDAFYRGSLVVRTPFDRARLAKLRYSGKAGIVWTDTTGESKTLAGSRYCEAQVDAILAELKRLDEERFSGTVGVVTPFRAQANRIRDAVNAKLPPQRLLEWQFISETADGFQGDERDVVLFSLIGAASDEGGTPPFYRKEVNRFNVAVSRARMVFHVFGDRAWARSCGIGHLERLVSAWEDQSAAVDGRVRWDLVGPIWEPALASGMRDVGLSFSQQYPACGYYLDFALFAGDEKLNVEVDGESFHRDTAGNRRLEDVYRDQALVAAGWKVLRFWVFELREDMGGCVEQIRRAFDQARAKSRSDRSEA